VPESAAIEMDGVRLADEMLASLRREIAAANGPPACIATLLVGPDDAGRANARLKHVRAREAGMRFVHRELAHDATQRDVEAVVAELAAEPGVHGVFVQLPLPEALDARAVADRIPPHKDIDGVSERSLARFARGEAAFAPATALAVMRLLKRHAIDLAGARALVVGGGDFGVPLATLLSRAAAASVSIVPASDPDLEARCRASTLIVSAAGVPATIRATHVAPGAIVVDAGVSRPAGVLTGDVDPAVRAVARAFVPMPGGVGPVTIACLLEHTWAAASANRSS
jgi:methylenetetrahydrofolate dehydrogenase (NADP+)/methenyltetrahydrofolate cyclohydrolase